MRLIVPAHTTPLVYLLPMVTAMSDSGLDAHPRARCCALHRTCPIHLQGEDIASIRAKGDIAFSFSLSVIVW